MARTYTELECFVCKRRFGRKMFNLKRHMNSHKPSEKSVECVQFKKLFSNKNNLKTHSKRKHSSVQNILFKIGKFTSKSMSNLICRWCYHRRNRYHSYDFIVNPIVDVFDLE